VGGSAGRAYNAQALRRRDEVHWPAETVRQRSGEERLELRVTNVTIEARTRLCNGAVEVRGRLRVRARGCGTMLGDGLEEQILLQENTTIIANEKHGSNYNKNSITNN
jgi:hypothetical protein